jgi:cytochrome P450
MMQPFFTVSRAEALCGMIVEYTNEMLDGWEANAKSGEPIDIASQMMRLTYRVIEKALFGTVTTEGMHEIEEAIGLSLECLYRRASTVFNAPAWMPTPMNRRYRRAKQVIDSRIHEIIEQHSGNANDLLSCLMKATDDETNERMTPQQLRNEMVTLLIGGHETTANAMTWLWYHVSRHAGVEQNLIDEAERVGDLNADSLSALEYTAMVIRESMRIHPPIWISPRNTLQDDEVHGYLIPAKSAVALCQWTTHRHPEFWPDAETFDPGRFEPARMKEMHPFAYFPFGAGPRNCIGQHIAFTEALVITSMIARRFRLRLAPGYRVEVQPGITLRSKYGMRILIEPLK